MANQLRFETLAQAAERIGVSKRTLRRRIAAGELPAYNSGSRILRVRPQDVDALFTQRFAWRPSAQSRAAS